MKRLRNIQKERMGYLWKTKKSIMQALYADAEKTLEKAMWQIAEENQKLIKGNSPTFFFNGRWWPIKSPDRPQECNRFLHNSLYAKIQEILDNNALNNDRLKAGVETVVSNFLMVSGHVMDLERLFPETVQGFIPPIDQEIFNIKEPLSDHEIQELLTENEINIQHLKRLLMTQVLLTKAI